MIIGSTFVGVVTAEEIIIDTEISESRFTEYPSRPAEGWFYVHDHDTIHTRAYDGNLWYTLCGEEGHGDPLYYGVWQASLPQSGDYEVFVWIPDPDPFVEDWPPYRTYTPTQRAVYQIYHKAGMTTKTVNQELRTGGFYSLGTFNFDTLASVILNDRTGESYLSTMIAFDAVKFVPVAAPNNPPYTPSNPSPANHATGQSIHTDLGWTGGDPDTGDTVTYDVYFGTITSPPKVSTAQSGITYDPGTLNYNTKYYWKIVATDNHGASTTGPLWDFTTGSALTCAIELRKNGAEIDEIDVGNFFDIYVGDSTDDTGIKDVRFSSDDSQDDIPTGAWTEWYNWDTHLEDWNAETKIKRWTFATAGEKEVWVEVRDNDEEVDQCHADIFVHPGYAIIVAGEGRRICDVPLIVDKKAIDHNANNAYSVLRNLGFDDDHIFYLNSNRPQNIDADGDDEVDAPAFFSDFESAINKVKNEIEDNPTPFILYLKGHGLPSKFMFSESNYLESYQLKGMLDQFSSEIPMLIIVDSCYSGSFINPLIGISSQNRIIITTTHADQERSWVGCLHSSDRLWGNLNNGLNVKEAFSTNILPPVGMAGALFTSDIHYLLLDDNGDGEGHPPNDLGTDGDLAARTQIGVPSTEILKLIDWLFVGLGSPGELRVYDTENRVTGLVNGEVKKEIPDSIYDEQNETVAIFAPSDAYRYEVVGTNEETYELDTASVEGSDTTTFTAIDIPTASAAVHLYTINWTALSQGEKGVTIQIDSDGDGTFEQTIITNNTFQPPIASFTYSPAHPVVNQLITFNASASYDPDGNITNYKWNFGDGNMTNTTDPLIIHTYVYAGDYTVNLTLTDDDGATDTDTTTLAVTEKPIANANGLYAGVIEYLAVPITFDGTGSYDPGGTIVSYNWDLDNDGEFDDAFGATPTVSFTAPYSGNIHLKVTDNNGATDTDTTTLTITKHSPPPDGIYTVAC